MRKRPSAPPLRFGTDGWRARIAEDYTFANVRRVATATARHFRASGDRRPVLVGYDTRFLSSEFARQAADSMAHEGVRVLLARRPTPTPAVSYFVSHQRLAGGVVITASHNPGVWNGFKIKTSDGTSADGAVTRDIESRIPDAAPPLNSKPPRVESADVLPLYLRALSAVLPRGGSTRVVADAMHGVAGESMELLFRSWAERATLLRTEPDPLFGGVHPEPIPPHVAPLLAASARGRATLGFCTDGDGDRVGAATGRGEFVNSHEIFCLVLLHLVEDLGMRGAVVKTVSTTIVIKRICAAFGLSLTETPVGFKYIATRMKSGGVLMGGEESGGIAVTSHLPERDGLYMGAALLRMCRMRGKDLAQLRTDLFRRFGSIAYDRLDLSLPSEEGRSRVERLRRAPPGSVAGLPVGRVNDADGLKLELRGDAWLMFRASGTEPILRVYAEAEKQVTVRKLLAAAPRLLGMKSR